MQEKLYFYDIDLTLFFSDNETFIKGICFSLSKRSMIFLIETTLVL